MRQKYRQKLLKTTNQGLDGQKTTKTKTEGIDNVDKKNCQDNFLSGQKGIYHQVEFYQWFLQQIKMLNTIY